MLCVLTVPAFLSHSGLASDVGSETTVSVETKPTFTESSNRMLAFGYFKNGFTLQDATVSCSFQSVFPVAGSIELNGGTLQLETDLQFDNTTTLSTAGIICGNGHRLILCESMSPLLTGESDLVLDNVYLDVVNDFSIGGTIHVKDTTVFDGNKKKVSFCDSGNIIVEDNATLVMKNMVLNGLDGTNLRCTATTSTILLDDVFWVQDSDFSFTIGTLEFEDAIDLGGSYTFQYTSANTSKIRKNSTLHISKGMTFKAGRNEAANFVEPLGFEDETSVLELCNSVFVVTDSGMALTKGKLILNEEVVFEVDSSSTVEGLHLGDGTTTGDAVMQIRPGTKAVFACGHFIYEGTSPSQVTSRSKSALIQRCPNCIFYGAQNVTFAEISLDERDGAVVTLEEGKTLTYDDVRVISPGAEFDLKGGWYDSSTHLISDDGEIFLGKGTIADNIRVEGTGNKLHGTGNISGVTTLVDAATELAVNLEGIIIGNIVLNGGKITIGGGLSLAGNAQIVGSGTIDLAACVLSIGAKERTPLDSISFEGAGGSVVMEGNMELSSTLTFDGNCILNGNDNVLSLGTGAELIVESGATLKLKDLTIKGVKETNISCVDDTSLLVLENVNWLQDEDFVFAQGAFHIAEKVTLGGVKKFTYQTSQTSTIQSNAYLRLDYGSTFSYDPPIADSGLLAFEDNQSRFIVRGATVHTTVTGMQMTSGKFIVIDDCVLTSESQYNPIVDETFTGVFTLGDQVAADDMICIITRGSELKLSSGYFAYKNVDATSWVSYNNLSHLRVATNARLQLYEQLDVGVGSVHFEKNAILERASGKSLLGAVLTDGQLLYGPLN